MRIPQLSGTKGSLRAIQQLVNLAPCLIEGKIKEAFPELEPHKIIWQSPLAIDDYAEYRDDAFIQKIGLSPAAMRLNSFWPARGPQWDALATTNKEYVILVEAKANIPELVSPASGASVTSKAIIDKSLNDTKAYLGIKNKIDWSGTFYQYTNRLAHLYFLRVIHNIPAFMLNVYFIGDKSVKGPESKPQWQAALKVMYTYLGVNHHKLSKFMAEIYINMDDLNLISKFCARRKP